MAQVLDDKFLYINSAGEIYDKGKYLLAVRSHKLTYSIDVDLTETDHRIDGDVVILAGKMLGHARLDGEAQVYHLRSMRVWRRRNTGWKLLAWQSSVLLQPPAWRSEEHTSELQSLMRNSYAVFCLKTKNITQVHHVKNSDT